METEKEHKLLDFLASIAWNDVRYFLACLRSIHALLGSEEKWSMSEVITALMLSKQIIAHSSGLADVYMPPHERFPCYFLKVRILAMLLFGRKQSERLQGASLRSIISFCRSYRYQERWTRTAIEEMVRNRLLECLEVPAAAEYTKDYEVEEDHSYRASPLAFTLLEYVQFDPVYLALLGNLLPFCQEDSYKRFLGEARGTLDLLAEVGFDRSGVKVIYDKNLGSIVAQYLIEALEIESPIGTPNLYTPEVAKTEEKIRRSVNKFKQIYPEVVVEEENKDQKPYTSKQATVNAQLPLFQDTGLSITDPEHGQEETTIVVPSKISNGFLKQYGHEPKIFWALVYLTAQGEIETTGSEVTRVINSHLCDDLHKVEPTNISRSLRGPKLQSRDWLRTNHLAERKKLYSLTEKWRQTWQDFFDERPPEF
ncbi:MAG: hypothetical protein F6J95_023355 [Leptolyngbya sp. SIO1E4]|nr:hypothetical protein [Leptolyngbya sp. SIO1E4]